MNKIYLLNNLKYKGVENLEVFKIEYIKSNVDLNIYDTLLFTSKNAVYSLNSFNTKWKELDSFAIAPMTANIIKEEGGKVFFTGSSGHGDDFAKELIPLLKNRKVLYIRALKVVSKLVEILKENHIEVDELITYKTVCNEALNCKLEDNSIIIFTSPSSVECFFKKILWKDTFKAVVIGKTTAKFMPKEVKYQISDKTSVQECIKVAQKLTF